MQIAKLFHSSGLSTNKHRQIISFSQGQVCAATVGKELRNAESASLACNLMDSVAVLWLCGMTLVFLYSGYIVWSCAEVLLLFVV